MIPQTIISSIDSSYIYLGIIYYIAIYPVFFGFVWSITALIHYVIHDRQPAKIPLEDIGSGQKVSIIIPIFNEEFYLEETLLSVTELNYDNYEIIVINDGSTDNSLQIIEKIAKSHPIKIINNKKNEGKAAALNRAVKYAESEVILFLDADAIPEVNILSHIMPHFDTKRVAAVTGNPRVRNVSSLLCCLQMLEFTSIISLMRRSQNLWGALMTVSGVIVAVSKKALLDVGGFKPNMSTEDICLAWDLQRAGYQIKYDSNAVVWMTVPSKLTSFVKQRMRWAKGLMEVLNRHKGVFLQPKNKLLWVIYAESVLSLIWAMLYIFFVIIFIVTYFTSKSTLGVDIVPLYWGGIVCTISLLMQIVGIAIENRHDKTVKYYFPYAILYPLIYWLIISIIAVVNAVHFFVKPSSRHVKWRHYREHGER